MQSVQAVMKSCLLFLVLVAPLVNAVSIDTASQHLRQPSYKETKKPEKNVPQVVKVENKVRKHHQNVMNAIDKFRAEVCAEMKDEYGVSFKTFKACHQFMEKTCKPGTDMKMNGEKHEVSSGEGFCKEYFPEAKRKAEEEVKKEEDSEAKAVSPMPFPGPAPAPAPAPKKEEKAPAPAPAKAKATATAAAPAPAAGGPAPGPAGGPGPAPMPGPFTPGKSGGKPWGAIAEDEAYYYKKDGKDASRLHMKEGQKLPTNGYWGKLVEHEDMETATGDWQAEFGPKSGHSAAEACRHHPDNAWCIRKGFGRNHKSAAAPAFINFAPFLLALIVASLHQ